MHNISCQKKGSCVPIRLTEEEKARLGEIAKTTGLTASTLIRISISALVHAYDSAGGTLTLPLTKNKNWRMKAENLELGAES